MSDELLHRFQDKIQGRPAPGRRAVPVPPDAAEEAQDRATLRVRYLDHGLFPAAARLNPGLLAETPRVRLTIDLGEEFRRRAMLLDGGARDRLLGLCPTVLSHACADRQGLHSWLSGEAPRAVSARPQAEPDGLPAAHLVEHVALDFLAAAAPGARRSGVTCGYKDRLDRYDVFFDCDDPVLGRTTALLSAASVRDLCLGQDRLGLHARCRDLLADLAARGGVRVAPEDVAASRSWSVPEAVEALQALARLGLLEPVSAPFTFSSATGLLFRRVTAG